MRLYFYRATKPTCYKDFPGIDNCTDPSLEEQYVVTYEPWGVPRDVGFSLLTPFQKVPSPFCLRHLSWLSCCPVGDTGLPFAHQQGVLCRVV